MDGLDAHLDQHSDPGAGEWPTDDQVAVWQEHNAHADSADLQDGQLDSLHTALGQSHVLIGAIRGMSHLLATSGAQLTVGGLTVDAASREDLLEVLGALITDARWLQRRIQAIRTGPAGEAR